MQLLMNTEKYYDGTRGKASNFVLYFESKKFERGLFMDIKLTNLETNDL